MASLNLVPNPTVLAVQAGVFLANLVIIKKLMLEPYLKVRERREKLVVGNKDEAQKMLADSEALSAQITSRLAETATSAKKERERMRDVAVDKRQTIMRAAEADSKMQVEAVERQIQQELAQEKSKVPGIVQTLTEEVYRLALA